MQNSAPNSKKCSKGAQRNRERPISDNREETQRDVTRKNNKGVKWEVLPDFYGVYGMDPIFVKVDVIPAPFKAAF